MVVWMARSQWHKFYKTKVAAPPTVLFELVSDLPNDGRWLPQSDAYGQTLRHTRSNGAASITTG